MGFPVEQVIRIASRFGKDDKKVSLFVVWVLSFVLTYFIYFSLTFQIVEHLIPLGELLDLGFDEIKISEALIQFNNNKEKALDYLIS